MLRPSPEQMLGSKSEAVIAHLENQLAGILLGGESDGMRAMFECVVDEIAYGQSH